MNSWWRRFWGRGRKAIFQFWDGRRWRYADPMSAIRSLQTHPTFNWATHPAAISIGDHEALGVTAAAMRDVFHLPEFDPGTGDGLTEGECCELLARFVAYLDGLKKSGDTSPSPPPSTAPESSSSPESPRPSDTSATLPSIGVPHDSGSDTPSPSPPASG